MMDEGPVPVIFMSACRQWGGEEMLRYAQHDRGGGVGGIPVFAFLGLRFMACGGNSVVIEIAKLLINMRKTMKKEVIP
jgi:hypothetical protein